MRKELKISTLSIVCALCATTISGAWGAASVRTLGGAGTYNGASSASSAGVARAGSVRVMPSGGNAVPAKATTPTTPSAGTTAGRSAAATRLSLGKYLGGGKVSVSTSPSTGGGTGSTGGGSSTMDPGIASELNSRVNALEDKTADLQVAIADKQSALTTKDDYIEIDNHGNISLLVDNLRDDLAGLDGADGRDVNIQVANGYIQWQHDGDTAWNNLISVAEISGPQGLQGEKGEKGDPGEAANLEQYSTTAQMSAAIEAAVIGLVTSDTLSQTLAEFPTTEEMDAALANKVDAGAVYTKTEIDTKIADIVTGDVQDVLDTALADKADATQVVQITQNITNINTTLENLGDDIESAAADAEQALAQTTIINNNITQIQEALETVPTTEYVTNTFLTQEAAGDTYISKTDIINGTQIEENTITNIEIAPKTITTVELDDGAVKLSNLNEEVAEQLVGTPDDGASYSILLVDSDGNRVWADLAE